MVINVNNTNNTGIEGSGNETIVLSSPVNYITITASFQGLLFSPDKGQTFVSVPSGTNNFRIGTTKQLIIQSTGQWEVLAELS